MKRHLTQNPDAELPVAANNHEAVSAVHYAALDSSSSITLLVPGQLF